MIRQPLDDFTSSSGTSEIVSLNRVSGKDELAVQVSISAAATVTVEGRLSVDAPWVSLTELTADGIQPIALVTQLRFSVSGNTGTVNAWVRY